MNKKIEQTKGFFQAILPSLFIAIAIVLFGYSLERAAEHIGDGMDDFGYMNWGSEVQFPSKLTIELQENK